MTAIQHLITSKIRIELLRIFTLSPQSSFNINELSRRTGFSIRGVEKELKNLHAGGILKRELAGNQHRYQFDPECPVSGEIKGLILKTVGVAERVKQALIPLEREIDRAFIYGSFATGDYDNESDVDLFLVTELPGLKVAEALSDVQNEIGRSVNVSQFSVKEYRERGRLKDHFLTAVLNGPRIILLGPEDDS
ncbi:MAG: nucleotidyltransferase domain-containing protein [Deltaproteobacteria bacterium]|nr:nucleotidyltransferase domain-containing protein [Deltaproteobacteria bacterium]